MKIALLQAGKTSEKYISEGIEVYTARIKRYTGFEIITVPDVKTSSKINEQELKYKEGKKILESVKESDYLVLLDEKGTEFRTIEFSFWLGNKLVQPGKRLLFIAGGAFGFSDEVYSKVNMRLSLSKMTFPHQLVRLIFVEQLYRALSIIKGSPYHHE